MLDYPEVLDGFAVAVLEGLSQHHKTVPARYLYDSRGSELFEEITGLPEYYPTRTETALLREHADDIRRLAGEGRALVEFGSGSSTKTPIVLNALGSRVYAPVDISAEFLRASAADLQRGHPAVRVIPVVGDFTQPLTLPELPPARTGFFPGSTIGNLGHADAVDLLRALRRSLGPDPRMIIGIDTRKNPRLLEAAYDDAAGVTAAFNLNLLHRINRELGGDIEIEAFEHRAVWHDGLGRIEMHLLATRDLEFRVCGKSFRMVEGETIHTENSYKYTLEEVRLLARAAGWDPVAFWTDADGMFGLHVWKGVSPDLQP